MQHYQATEAARQAEIDHQREERYAQHDLRDYHRSADRGLQEHFAAERKPGDRIRSESAHHRRGQSGQRREQEAISRRAIECGVREEFLVPAQRKPFVWKAHDLVRIKRRVDHEKEWREDEEVDQQRRATENRPRSRVELKHLHRARPVIAWRLAKSAAKATPVKSR